MIGESSNFLAIQEQVSRLAALSKPALIVGERGTGKELIAARVHYLSERWEQAFLKVNCAAISESLMESELFGHELGAFSGATRLHRGYFERAHGGTLFLDEIATASPGVQEKLLRLIEYGELIRVGGDEVIEVDVRLVAASNSDLPGLARIDQFRADLLDRLAFDVITLPPLRSREEDVLLLADYFAVRMVKELKREYFPGFNANAVQSLREYSWPGNVRELKNVVERAVYRSENPDEPIDQIIFDPFESPYSVHLDANVKATDQDINVEPATGSQTLPAPQVSDLKQHIHSMEIKIIQETWQSCQFNQRKTAEKLGLTYHQLRAYMRKHSLLSAG
jgi:psp operon transcriptional activator